MTITNSTATWVLVPAAGSGSRMGASLPKQYLSLGNQCLLEMTLQRLLQLPNIAGLIVALSPDDHHWQQLSLSADPRIQRVDGGRERANSVLQGLHFLADRAQPDDWVLVHDAARPCVRIDDIANLREALKDHPVGGILGVPVSDTLKQVNHHKILSTQDRSNLWQAQTPQMFRYGLLRDCLSRALSSGLLVTDEASALEAFDYQPLMVQGHADNLKVTRAEDLQLARWILAQQSGSASIEEETP
jgi:2-C-methyl-D-erythritol 4-phosphate cytidylyltransferase